MLVGIGLFSVLNGVVKAQMEVFPPNQVILFRNAFALVPLWFMLLPLGGLAALRSARIKEHVVLSVLFTGTLLCIFFAYSIMPLVDVTAISFTQPLLVSVFAFALRLEKTTRLQWLAVAIGLGGVLVMVQPTGGGPVIGGLIALVGSAMGAASMLIQRRLSTSDSTQSIAFYTLGISALLMLPLMFYSYVTPTSWQLAGLIGMGVASGICQYVIVRAFYHATASEIAPMTYTKIIWAVIIGYLWFSEVPTLDVMLGSIAVMGATYLAFRSAAAARMTI
ncbi:MAG: DMT family transporter [Rhodobacteraceae bacterium]|nr:DMT family transporter [Paracoccaceae bacterium]